jgi:hypothetical protein
VGIKEEVCCRKLSHSQGRVSLYGRLWLCQGLPHGSPCHQLWHAISLPLQGWTQEKPHQELPCRGRGLFFSANWVVAIGEWSELGTSLLPLPMATVLRWCRTSRHQVHFPGRKNGRGQRAWGLPAECFFTREARSNTCLNCFCWKAPAPYLGPLIKRRKKPWLPCLYFVSVITLNLWRTGFLGIQEGENG